MKVKDARFLGMGKDYFSQTELLKYLTDPEHKAECAKCGKTAFDIQLELNHKDHNKEHDTYDNIEILCINCHQKLEGRDTKNSDLV